MPRQTPFHRILLMTLYATGGTSRRSGASEDQRYRQPAHGHSYSRRQGPQGPRCHAQPEAARSACASIGADSSASPPTGCFPAIAGIHRASDRHQGSLVGLPARGRTRRPRAQAYPSTHAAPLLCHPSARSRCRPAHHPDAARSSRSGGDHDLSASLPAASQRDRQSAGCSPLRAQGERTAERDEPASSGDGRHRSLRRAVLSRTQSQWITLATPEGPAGDHALPHRCAGRPSRSLLRLRTSPPSPTTRAATATARSARATRANAGSRRVNGSFCPHPTSTSSSPCRVNWLRSHCRTSS